MSLDFYHPKKLKNYLLNGLRKHGIMGSAAILKDIILQYYYRLRCNAVNACCWSDPTEEDNKKIEEQLRDHGVRLESLILNKKTFKGFENDFNFGDDFYGGRSSGLYKEKVLEHYLAYTLSMQKLFPGGTYVDIAAANSPWAKLLREKGINAFAIDLSRSSQYGHLDFYRIMDATRTSFADQSVDFASLQCAFEMFNKDDDIQLILELGRILKHGGSAIICPLYLHTHYSGFSSPDFYFKKTYHDLNAKLYLAPNGMKKIPFARFYDADQLVKRIIKVIRGIGLSYRIYVIKDEKQIDPSVYCKFILEIKKDAT